MDHAQLVTTALKAQLQQQLVSAQLDTIARQPRLDQSLVQQALTTRMLERQQLRTVRLAIKVTTVQMQHKPLHQQAPISVRQVSTVPQD